VKHSNTNFQINVGDQGKNPVFTFGLWCLNPEIVFKDITSRARSVILTSGTLAPMETFSSELGTNFENRLEALHVIDPEQVWVGAVGVGSQGVELKGTFKELETFAFQDEISKAILDICRIVPDGVLCFLPSYYFMEKLMQRMEGTGVMGQLKKLKKIYTEPRQGNSTDFEKTIRSYYSSIQSGRGALFFAVFRGKVSEGLDFADANARAVISIGIPFPALKDEKVVQKRTYKDLHYRDRNLLNGNLWYDKQAYRALNQALGRCIRHRHDWGAIILLERRFHYESNINGLSKWIRPRVQKFTNYQESLKSLEKYIEHMKHDAVDIKKDRKESEDFVEVVDW
jgi:Fanconi anemia group J protein